MNKPVRVNADRQYTRRTRVEPSRARESVSPEARRFFERFAAKYDEALKRLARR